MRATLITAVSLLGPFASACERCRPAVKASVYDGHFLPNLGLILLPLGLLVGGVLLVEARKERAS